VSSRWPAHGGLAACISDAGRCGFGCVLAGLGRGDGALWVGAGEVTAVGNVQRAEGEEGGVWVVLLHVFLVSRPGSGQGRLGLDRGMSTSMATGPGANGNSVGHSRIDFPKFCPPGARHNARKNSKFEFLKSFTLGC
jgi:hypothetical protein